jgi:hypothetical protein
MFKQLSFLETHIKSILNQKIARRSSHQTITCARICRRIFSNVQGKCPRHHRSIACGSTHEQNGSDVWTWKWIFATDESPGNGRVESSNRPRFTYKERFKQIISLVIICERINCLHCDHPLTSEDFLSIRTCIVHRSVPEIWVTAGTCVASVCNMNMAAVPECGTMWTGARDCIQWIRESKLARWNSMWIANREEKTLTTLITFPWIARIPSKFRETSKNISFRRLNQRDSIHTIINFGMKIRNFESISSSTIIQNPSFRRKFGEN